MSDHEEKLLLSNIITSFKLLVEYYDYRKIVIDASENSIMVEKNDDIKQIIPIQQDQNNENDDDEEIMVNNNINFFLYSF